MSSPFSLALQVAAGTLGKEKGLSDCSARSL